METTTVNPSAMDGMLPKGGMGEFGWKVTDPDPSFEGKCHFRNCVCILLPFNTDMCAAQCEVELGCSVWGIRPQCPQRLESLFRGRLLLGVADSSGNWLLGT